MMMQSFENYAKATSTLVGPWGGQEGHHWDDGVHSTIRQLEIAHGAAIDSIRIEYDNNGRSVWSEKHGGYGGTTVDKIRLQYPDEYLISLQGHYGSLQEHGPVFIRSLTFESNKGKIYGPYGVERGTLFTLPKNDRGKIVGFLGKSGWYLDAIGAYVEPPHDNLTNVAPTSMVQAQYQKHVVHGSEKYEYSMIQSSLGTNYDLIVAVKQKNDTTNPTPTIPPNKNSHNITSHTEHKNEVPSVIPPKIEKVPSKRIKEIFTRGPWGGNGGSPFDDGIYDGIRQINLSRNVGIVYIRACYERDGHHVWGNKNGGTGGYKSDKVVFDYPSEILTHITGYHGPIMGMDVIKSLTFHTTKGKHGPYGEEQGEFFSTKSKEGSMIVGFHGRKGLFLDAIGVHLLEGKSFHSTPNKLAPSPPVKTNNQTTLIAHKADDSAKTTNQTALVANKVDKSPKFNHQMALVANKVDDSPKTNYQMASVPSNADNSQWHFKIGKRGQNEEAAHRMVKNPAPCGPGPWGGDGGKQWDDGVYTGIKHIILTLTDAICCIEIEYDRNGQALWSVKHGGSGGGGQAVNRVKLDYPHEVLTCISGYYGPLKKDQGTKVVKSLTFHTSRKKYGPFGEELGTYFESGRTEGKVVGFHGRSSMYLDAIGVHMQHWLGNQKTKPSSLMKMFS